VPEVSPSATGSLAASASASGSAAVVSTSRLNGAGRLGEVSMGSMMMVGGIVGGVVMGVMGVLS